MNLTRVQHLNSAWCLPAALATLAATTGAGAQSLEWVRIGPDHRYDHKMVYDSARDRLVVFGGRPRSNQEPLDPSVWEFDGSQWRQHSAPGPSARIKHAMTYNSTRGVTVVFGGTYETADTWEWNGQSWTQRQVQGPSARTDSEMVHDAARGVDVLFGGTDAGNPYLGDTWELNAAGWVQRASNGPHPRSRLAMGFDSVRGRTVLFGGLHSSTLPLETWEWDGSAWTVAASGYPVNRYDHSMVFDAARARMVMFSNSSTSTRLIHEYDAAAWVYRDVTTSRPPSATNFGMAYDSTRQLTYVWGGGDLVQEVPNTLWAWNGALWTRWTTTDPGLFASPLAFDSARGRIIAYGTAPSSTDPKHWERTGLSWTSRSITGPSERHSHAMVYDPVRDRVVLFGGWGSSGTLSDTWLFDGSQWQQGPAGPPAGSSVRMVFDPVRQVVVAHVYRNIAPEHWEWNGSAWTRRLVALPSAYESPALAFDARRGVVVFFGGAANGGIMNETWEWDGDAWTQRQVSGPPPRVGHAMAYDSDRGVTVLMGGTTGNGSYYYGDTWEWNGAEWRQVLNSPPSGALARSGHGMVYDPTRRAMVMLGGFENADGFETWELRVTCYANCDGTALLTANDFQCFLNKYAANDPYANCDQSTGTPALTANDFQCFLNTYVNGCP